MQYHIPVLVDEVIQNLSIQDGKVYIDATLGDGGHTIEILKRGGKVLAFDVNEGSIIRAVGRIRQLGLDKNFKVVRGNFVDIEKLAVSEGYSQVDGILLDLGISMSQLKEESLGLSFEVGQDLDMRIDRSSSSVKAFDLINGLYANELEKLFRDFGGERYASVFAKKIVEFRKLKKIQTAQDLAVLLKESFPGYEKGRIHPATRVFQALRIAVNNELSNLMYALPQAARILKPGGRLLVISFNSLEDKIVKDFGKSALPNEGLALVNKKPIEPTENEIAANSSSRSSKLRVFEKTKNL